MTKIEKKNNVQSKKKGFINIYNIILPNLTLIF